MIWWVCVLNIFNWLLTFTGVLLCPRRYASADQILAIHSGQQMAPSYTSVASKYQAPECSGIDCFAFVFKSMKYIYGKLIHKLLFCSINFDLKSKQFR